MIRRDFLKKISASLISAPLLSFIKTKKLSAKKTEHPNLIYIFADQMRGQAIGFLKEEPVITPNLDALAKESLVLPHTASNYPVCSPYRAMLMTGKYSHSNKVLENCTSAVAPYDNQLQATDRCWSDILKDKGYSLGYIGKWHLDAPHKPYVKSYNNKGKLKWNEFCPPNRRHGFDFWYSYGTFDMHMKPEYWATDTPRDGRIKVRQWGPEHETDLAIKYIRNQDQKYRKDNSPFGLVISFNPPHPPYQHVPGKYRKIYKDKDINELCKRPNIPPENTRWGKYYRKHIKDYYAAITGIDEQIGRIMKVIKEQNLDKNTIVIFTSDHGNNIGIHNYRAKQNHFEESMRVPFMIRWKGKIKPGSDDLLLSSPDINPTMMELMGFAGDIPEEVEGVSHAGLFLTGEGKRPTSQLYMRVPMGKPAFGRRGVRTLEYTLMIDKKPDASEKIYELYDNKNDPYQLENIADSNKDIIEKLVNTELNPWLKKTKDPWLEG